MEGIIEILNTILQIFFYLFFIVIFYLSIKKCFLTEGKSRVKLFFMTLFTQPIVLLTITTFVVTIFNVLVFVIKALSEGVTAEELSAASMELSVDPLFSFLVAFPSSAIFIMLVILFSHLIGKWLKAYNTSLVTYAYMMFAVIYDIKEGSSYDDTAGNGLIYHSIMLVKLICVIIAILFMYRYVIKALSELTDRRRELSWKIFVLPPSIFVTLYTTVDIFSFRYGDIMTYVIAQFLSLVILFLFIWAFYIIIKNINVSNVAIAAMEKIKTLSVEVMEALAHTIDAKDKYTNGHSIRVAHYSRMIAEKMNMSTEECENIYYMGLLHDIGKIGVPNAIINKPTHLSNNEYEVIKTHPEIGFDILAQITSSPALSYGARWHHERYDGKGYPDGLSGDAIPIEARIIAAADTYDAMTSNRSYRQYLPQETVRAEIEKNAGSQFDPAIVKYMLMIIDEDKDYVLHE